MSKEKKTLSPNELAQALGVSESSMKRWIDSGKIEAIRTPGGHRRIPFAEAMRFIRASDHDLAKPETLGLPDAQEAEQLADPTDFKTSYHDALKNGIEADIRSFVMFEYSQGKTVADIADELILPGFKKLRDECTHPSEKCVTLHRAVSMSQNAFLALRDLAPPLEENSPKVLLADIGYEIDCLPVYAAEAVMQHEGLNPTQLGRSVHSDVLLGSISRAKPNVIYLSAAGPVDTQELTSLTKRTLELASEHHASVILYGPAFPTNLTLARGARTVNSMRELSALAAGLGNMARV